MMLAQNVSNVTIRAELALDPKTKKPITFKPTRRTHYKVRLWLEGVPEDAHAVTWILHESYRDPVREVLDGPHFLVDITTYGDYEVTAKVRRRRFGEGISVRLSEALAASHPNPTPEIQAALDEIRRS